MNDTEIKTYRLIIKGKVQNVGFRHWFSDLAISLGLNGYVQNLANKDEVEAIVQGNIKNILNITEKSKSGPQMSLVEGVIPNQIISNVKYSGFIEMKNGSSNFNLDQTFKGSDKALNKLKKTIKTLKRK